MSLLSLLCNKVIFTRNYRCEYLRKLKIKKILLNSNYLIYIFYARYGLTLFVWIVIVCTWIHNSTLKSSEIVKEMSINVNYSQIANKPSKVQKQHILFFDGLRFVNFSWIIVGHAFLYISMAFSFFTFLGKLIKKIEFVFI